MPHKILNKITSTLFFILLLFSTGYALASPQSHRPSWRNWILELRQEALAQGIRPQLFDSVFHGLTPDKRLIRLDRRQPETRLTFLKYRNTRGDAYRIKLGRREYRRYRQLIDKIGKAYDVDPCFIVALWGIESSYGRYMGNYHVIRSLATLAYDRRRSAFFRRELFYALHILNEGHVNLKDFKGEWAGGSGHPQFLPSSWYNYAVDYNLDGYKDIWRTHSDVFASIANYLAKNGWQDGQPLAIAVNVPSNFDHHWVGYDYKKPVREWQHMGIRAKNGDSLPAGNLIASLVEPRGGPYLLVFNNFRVLLTWNRSTFYAGTVGYIADKICYRR